MAFYEEIELSLKLLLDTSNSNPALPDGHPFKLMDAAYTSGLRDAAYLSGGGYWTITEYGDDGKSVWKIQTGVGKVTDELKIFDAGLWPVHDSN